jgi:hypothetical protein
MKIIFSLFKNLATVLPFLRIFTLLAIVLLGTGALLFSVMYIQSIGSGLSSFGGLFILSLVPIKPKRLTKSEREKISLTPELTEILVGLLLGDLAGTKVYVNPLFRFYQGLIHKDYLDHLYELFKIYCLSEPKVYNRPADSRTGKKYSSVSFNTCSLPCFN